MPGTGFEDHFEPGPSIAPQPWMQQRWVAGASVAAVSKNYDTSGGGNKNESVQTVKVSWENTTPVTQWVYGMVTRDGCSVFLQARSRGYLLENHGFTVGPTGDGISMAEVSRHGVGGDVGKGGVLAAGTGFAVSEFRVPASTYPLAPQYVGLVGLAPGEKFHAQVDIRFRSDYWERTQIDGGESGTASGYVAGEMRIDLFALPAVPEPPPRPVPTLVDGGAVSYDTQTTVDTEVEVGPGVIEGDILIAIVANNFGLASDITPVETGWTQLAVVNDGLGGWEDTHLKVFMRTASADEPATYSFNNGLAAQEIAAMFAVRNASPNPEDGWYVASAVRRNFIERDKGHIAPSIDRKGKFLVAVSYFAKNLLQADVTQTSPTGMTELADIAKSASSMAIAVLPDPPSPTLPRTFVPSMPPLVIGRSIALTLLIPGALGT